MFTVHAINQYFPLLKITTQAEQEQFEKILVSDWEHITPSTFPRVLAQFDISDQTAITLLKDENFVKQAVYAETLLKTHSFKATWSVLWECATLFKTNRNLLILFIKTQNFSDSELNWVLSNFNEQDCRDIILLLLAYHTFSQPVIQLLLKLYKFQNFYEVVISQYLEEATLEFIMDYLKDDLSFTERAIYLVLTTQSVSESFIKKYCLTEKHIPTLIEFQRLPESLLKQLDQSVFTNRQLAYAAVANSVVSDEFAASLEVDSSLFPLYWKKDKYPIELQEDELVFFLVTTEQGKYAPLNQGPGKSVPLQQDIQYCNLYSSLDTVFALYRDFYEKTGVTYHVHGVSVTHAQISKFTPLASPHNWIIKITDYIDLIPNIAVISNKISMNHKWSLGDV